MLNIVCQLYINKNDSVFFESHVYYKCNKKVISTKLTYKKMLN